MFKNLQSKSVALLLLGVLSGSLSASAADKWVKTAPGNLTSGDVVVIVDQHSGTAMSNNNGTSKAPTATAVTLTEDQSEISSDVAYTLQWEVTVSDGSYQFGVGDDYLYCTNANNGVRVGSNDNNAFTIYDNDGVDFLLNTTTKRYLGAYNSQDWRCYTSINNNIKDCVTVFYKKVAEEVGEDQVATPVISGDNEFFNSTTVSISTETDGASIYYTTDGSEPTAESNAYTEAFTIAATTTVKAIAVKDGMTDSYVVSATFTKINVLDNIAALTSQEAGTYYVQLTNATVTGVYGNYAYIQDASGAVEINTSNTLTAGQVLNGIANVTFKLQNNNPQIQGISGDYEVTDGEAPTPTVVAQSAWNYSFADILAQYMKIVNATIYKSGNYYYVDLNEEAIQVYAPSQGEASLSTLDLDKTYSIVGYPVYYNSYKEIKVYVQPEEKQLLANDITVVGGVTQTIDRTNDEEQLTFSATATSGATVTFSLVSSTLSENDYLFEGNTLLISGTKGGVVVINAHADATEDYMAADQEITVTVIGAKEDPIFDLSDAAVAYGETYTFDPTDAVLGGDVTLTSSNTAVATVEGLVVTPVAVGAVTITVSTAEDATYKAGSDVFTLTINAPVAQTTVPSAEDVVLFNETFDKSEGTGGRDEGFTGSVGTASLTGKTDEEWSVIGNNGASKCIKLGTGKAAGTVETRDINLDGTATLTFDAAGWGDENSNNLTVKANGGTINGEENASIELTNGEFTSYEYTVTGEGTITLEFVMKRGFLDEIKLFQPGTPVTVSATISESGYATLCSLYPIDFTTTDGFKAYVVSSIEGTTVTMTRVTSKVAGGVPVVLVGTAGTYQMTLSDSETEPETNLLEGTLAPTYLTTVNGDYTNFGLKSGKFVKINNGVVPANKAYLPVLTSSLNAEANQLSIIFDDSEVTGISEVQSNTARSTYYNLNGQQVEAPAKGLFIHDGKKLIVK